MTPIPIINLLHCEIRGAALGGGQRMELDPLFEAVEPVGTERLVRGYDDGGRSFATSLPRFYALRGLSEVEGPPGGSLYYIYRR